MPVGSDISKLDTPVDVQFVWAFFTHGYSYNGAQVQLTTQYTERAHHSPDSDGRQPSHLAQQVAQYLFLH